jgi:hypothetical protein
LVLNIHTQNKIGQSTQREGRKMDSRNHDLTEETSLVKDKPKDNPEEISTDFKIDYAETHLDDEIFREVLENLKALNISEDSAKRIMNAAERMPNEDHVKGALRFFTHIRDDRHKREEYYQWSPYVAEFFCTISNLGIFAAGAYSAKFSALIAATFSILSHAIPTQLFQTLDQSGAVFGILFEAAIQIGLEWDRIKTQPTTLLTALAYPAGALAIGFVDTLPSRIDYFYPGFKKEVEDKYPIYKEVIAPTLHSTWHSAGGIAIIMFYATLAELLREPSKTEETIATIWGCIGIALCLLPVVEVVTRKALSACKSTLYGETNNNLNSSNNPNYRHSTEPNPNERISRLGKK